MIRSVLNRCLLIFVVLIPLFLIGFKNALFSHNYLLFHSLVEIFCVVVAGGIFMFAWNTRKLVKNDYYIFLGIAYLFVGFLDFLHTISYKGMGVFSNKGADLATQLWVAARYMESFSLLSAPFFMRKTSNAFCISIAFSSVFCCVLLSIFIWKVFPVCYIDGVGLTAFKKSSEYGIVLLLILATVSLFRKKSYFNQDVFHLIVGSISITIVSELCFTIYVDVYGFFNFMGHFLKLVSFYLIYRATIVSGMIDPYKSLFHNLKEREDSLRIERDHLQDAMQKIKTLKGLLPICASCKKIRDDRGYWKQIETYIIEHSDADFSHGICPDCARKLYPEYFGETGLDGLE